MEIARSHYLKVLLHDLSDLLLIKDLVRLVDLLRLLHVLISSGELLKDEAVES